MSKREGGVEFLNPNLYLLLYNQNVSGVVVGIEDSNFYKLENET